MPDRKKYIEVLSKTVKKVKEFNEDTPIKISLECVEDILELLKEQETANLYKCPNCGTWVSAENVVRCKDCKNWTVGDIGTYCPYHHDARPDWFCADGERR